MSGRKLARLALAAALAAGVGKPSLAQSERNSRLLPQATAPAAVPAPQAAAAAAVPPLPVPTVAVTDAAAEAVAAPTVLPGAAATAFPPAPATGSQTAGTGESPPAPAITAAPPPVPRALPPAPRPPAVPVVPPAAVAAAPAPQPTVAVAAPPPVVAVPARVRTPLPAVRVAPPAGPALEPGADETNALAVNGEAEAALDTLAQRAETEATVSAESDSPVGATAVVLEAAPEAPASAEDALDVMARDAQAMRLAAEQEQAAVAAQQILPRPAPRVAADVDATETVAAADERPGPPVTPEETVADAVPVVTAAEPEPTVAPEQAVAVEQAVVVEHDAPAEPTVAEEAAVAAEPAAAVEHDAATAGADHAVTDAHTAPDPAIAAEAAAPTQAETPTPEAPPHDAASPLHDAPAAPAEHAPAPAADGATAVADAAGGGEDRDGRPGGVRWIAGAGLPPPNPEPPVAAPASHAATADADGEPHDAAPGTTAVADAPDAAPRVRRRPSTPPIAAPYELVRTLQAMQDDMAGGSTAALAAQRTLLQRMEEEFAGADPLVWQDRRNARALVAYTLGGGRPVTLRQLLASETPPDGDAALMRGALAYVEGDEATARKYLTDIDATSLPASLGGQLALAQAALAVGEDPKKAMLLLDTARLLAPGTLVEEAALRRQIFVASELKDLDRFEALSGQYLRRFRRSVYAGNFRRRFAAALSRMEFLDDPGQFHRLDEMLAETDPEARRELYLVVAQAAVNEGKTVLAATAAERALASAPAGSVDEARGRLYRGAALAVTSDGLDAAMTELGRVERDGLPRTDAALLQAASETAMLIRTAAAAAATAHERAVEAPPEDEKPSATVTRARDALAAIDTLLEQAQ